MKKFQDKVVFITGASSGIGAACAELFAENGAKLLLCARRHNRLHQLAERLRSQFNSIVHIFELDISKPQDIHSKLAALPAAWQAVDVLVNNAGLAAGLAKFNDAHLEDWDLMIDTNLRGLLHVTKRILPNMIARNHGHIINIGSVAGHQTYANGNVYCATKYAVRAINQCLKIDLTGTAIRVSSVDPGMVHTEFSEVRFKGDKPRAEAVYAGLTPLNAADIADAVFYCASRPPHVNILELVVYPTAQSAPTIVSRD